MYFTCLHKNFEFTEFLLEHGANVNKVCNVKTGDCPIHVVLNCTKNKYNVPNETISELLLNMCGRGADLNSLNLLL